MKEIIRRVEKEKAELDKKITALGVFITSVPFTKLDKIMRTYLNVQIAHMKNYSEVLQARLKFMKEGQ